MTPGWLPAGYDGSLALAGASYLRMPGGVNQKISDCWIKEINGAPLAEKKMYRGIFGGTLEQVSEVGSGSIYSLPLFYVESPPQPVVDHYTPSGLSFSSYFTLPIPGFMTFHFYQATKGWVGLGAKLSNIFSGAPWDPVLPRVMVRRSGAKLTHPLSGQLFDVLDWYHIPQFCRLSMPIAYSASPYYTTTVLDPLGLTSKGIKDALCSYEILDANYSYYTGRSDQLTVISVGASGTSSSIGPVMGA